ncbi:hypothetical protein C454_00200 [Haloferax gibbonsii ATCC 33959]|uniref:Uncharacterized protein n=1 Tax=Haloferax gibbonsii (strain ATCC 33959 / DSM 4427 / JCM 8863 / NBRC 102184 / NCIMB 2188 / Ma 2.38) TaxID=1227459 RepID=M0HUX7_HALGM|nr:hypothetical protein C454_00200 [Haloferax gibbonsii ATCC 33959]
MGLSFLAQSVLLFSELLVHFRTHLGQRYKTDQLIWLQLVVASFSLSLESKQSYNLDGLISVPAL